MLSTDQVSLLAAFNTEEWVGERQFDREVRNQRAKEAAQRNLRRDIEKLLQADGSTQSVLDVLKHFAPEEATLRIDSRT